jgi:long-chain acyl-CoA synthetase
MAAPYYRHMEFQLYNLGDLLNVHPRVSDVIDVDPTNLNQRSCTTQQLDSTAQTLASHLYKEGYRPRDRIAILADNCLESIVCYLAILKLGGIVVMISSKATSSQVATMLQDSAVKLVFTDLQIDTNLVVFDLTQVLEKFASGIPFESYRPNDHDIAIIIHTSGSTGKPRRVNHTHRARLNILDLTGYSTYNSRTLVANPFYHAMGIHALDTHLYKKNDVVFLKKFEPVAYLKAIDSLCPINLIGVPSMFAMLMLQQELIQTLNLSSVKHITLSGGATTQGLNTQLTQAFKNTKVQVGYGSTELGSKIFGDHATLPRPQMSVGCEREGILYRLADNVLQVRSPYMMKGYDDNNSSFTHDGYYITNDQFKIDQDGFYYFIGRSDDMFKSGGNKIFPSEIERVIEQYPGVDKCATLPIKDSIKEFKPYAFVTLMPGSVITSQELSNFLMDKLARYQQPRQIWILNGMPLTVANKIDKQQLTVLAEQNLNAQKLLDTLPDNQLDGGSIL